MLFNSFQFILLFVPLTLAGFFLLGRASPKAAATWLALASLFFYGWWSVRYVPLLLGSIAFNFVAGLGLHALRSQGRKGALRLALAAAVAVDLGVLGYYKYAGFFVTTVNGLAGLDAAVPNIVLPLGISFFTFTQIAFLVDTARGQASEPSFIHFTLFVTYFPHLIAGPILHHRAMMPQLTDPAICRPRASAFVIGLSYFAIGLAKKTLLADSFAPDVGVGFSPGVSAAEIGAIGAWQAALGYTLQIYFDFSGYSDMAVGVSRFFGIRLPYNFRSPYRAPSISEFWRRWHMTLSAFLRDYLYIALGGNRRGAVRRYLNLLATMLLGGLWHGASWTFVVWGGLHGIYLVINHAWRALPLPRLPRAASVPLSAGLTFLAVVLAWVFFRAPSFEVASSVLGAMAGLHGGGQLLSPTALGNLEAIASLLGVGTRWSTPLKYLLGFALVFALPSSQEIMEELGKGGDELPRLRLRWRASVAWALSLGALTAVSLLTFARVTEFLYFQF